MPYFQGGPLDGMKGYEPSIDGPLSREPTEEDFAGMGMGGGEGGGMGMGMGPGGPMAEAAPASEDDGISATQRFDRILSDARALAGSDGEYSEQDKLVLERVTSLLQQLKAGQEKEGEQMMQGKVSPGAMRRAYSMAQGA